MNTQGVTIQNIRVQSLYKSSCDAGFTLIEVMVALMILAVVAVTASQASSGYLRTVDGMKTRTLAHFVAQNMATDLMINEGWLSSGKQSTVTEQGYQWQVTYTPSPLDKISNISNQQQLQQVNIHVVKVLENTNKTGTGTDISIVLSKPQP